MLKQHDYYVYHEGKRVYGRRFAEERVLIEECETPQAAHDLVQQIINPSGRPASSFNALRPLRDAEGKIVRDDKGDVVKEIVNVGYHAAEFQNQISDNCRAVVDAAYAKQSG